MAITPHPLIGFASEYMHWKALLRDFPLDGVLSTTTHDKNHLKSRFQDTVTEVPKCTL
jgi:hypothetical protein